MLIEANLKKILAEYYDILNPTLLKMEGYDSINYKVSTKSNSYVLKIYPFHNENVDWITAEDEVTQSLSSKNINCSEVILNKKNTFYVTKHGYIYRLLTFIKGEFLAKAEHNQKLLKSFGIFLGQMDIQLSNLSNYIVKSKETVWDLKHFQKNWNHLNEITNLKDRNLVHYFCLQFSENVVPIQYQLRQSILHNDANDWNVLTTNNQIVGIIDFGDICHSWLINELAIALTYILMEKEKPLEIAKTVIKSYHAVNPLKKLELDVLYYLIAARLCTSVLNSAHTKKLKPNSEYIVISEKPAWQLLKKWITINPLLAKNEFRSACNYPIFTETKIDSQIKHRHKNVSKALSLSYEIPIQMQGAAFQYMYDSNGNTFLDAYNNIMQVGHCHPKVVEAGHTAMAKLNTNTRYIYKSLLSYTDKLLAKFPKQLSKVFLVNSGSAASDLAIRLAKTHTSKNKIIVLEHGYHGNTQNGIDISHYKYNHKGGNGKNKNIIEAKLPKYFGSNFSTEDEFTKYHIALLKKQIAAHKGTIAAFIAEPIVGCGGQVPLPKNYLKAVYQLIREQGGVCISDEVQVGFGRLGSHFWGYEMYNVQPDIVILGKPIGNGHPLGAVITTNTISKDFNNGMEFFSSFGGNPISCAIGEAVLNVINQDKLQEQALKVGAHLKNQLNKLKKQHTEIADVRGNGLFLGVEVLDQKGNANTQLASYLKNELRLCFILIGTDGPFDNVLKIKPPLYFTKNNADQLCQEMERILINYKKINTFS